MYSVGNERICCAKTVLMLKNNIPIKRRLDYYEALETARNGNLRDFIKIIISLMSTKDYII